MLYLYYLSNTKLQRYRGNRSIQIDDGDSKVTSEDNQETSQYSPLLFYAPALCDVTATSIMYIALTLTSASSFQMLRGSIMIFVGNIVMLYNFNIGKDAAYLVLGYYNRHLYFAKPYTYLYSHQDFLA